MEINATLIGQFITFILLVWFTMNYVWPPIMQAINERQLRIAEGLAAAERGVYELELAHHKSNELLRDAKIQAADIIEEANKKGMRLIDDAKERARQEGERLLTIAKNDVQQEMVIAQQSLRQHVGQIAVKGAEKILRRHLDEQTDSDIIAQLIDEL